jgi:hypothetical protein
MFVRFKREGCRRLSVNLVHNRRVCGKVVTEQIARLGSCLLPEPISAPERIRFWDALPNRWRQHPRLINMSLDDRRRALDQLAERIPQPSPAEIAQVLERLQRWAA